MNGAFRASFAEPSCCLSYVETRGVDEAKPSSSACCTAPLGMITRMGQRTPFGFRRRDQPSCRLSETRVVTFGCERVAIASRWSAGPPFHCRQSFHPDGKPRPVVRPASTHLCSRPVGFETPAYQSRVREMPMRQPRPPADHPILVTVQLMSERWCRSADIRRTAPQSQEVVSWVLPSRTYILPRRPHPENMQGKG